MIDTIELLQKTVLFKGCTRQELDLTMGLLQERTFKPNMTIFAEKMPAESLYIIKDGNVRITVMAGEGEEKSLLLLGPGEFFGEMALLQEGSRMVTARSETDVELLMLSRKDFQTLVDLYPRMAARMLGVIAKLLSMRVKVYSAMFRELLIG